MRKSAEKKRSSSRSCPNLFPRRHPPTPCTLKGSLIKLKGQTYKQVTHIPSSFSSSHFSSLSFFLSPSIHHLQLWTWNKSQHLSSPSPLLSSTSPPLPSLLLSSPSLLSCLSVLLVTAAAKTNSPSERDGVSAEGPLARAANLSPAPRLVYSTPSLFPSLSLSLSLPPSPSLSLFPSLQRSSARLPAETWRESEKVRETENENEKANRERER